MKTKKNSHSLTGLAENLISFGRKQGADEIEVSIFDSSEFTTDLRFGKIENLVEAGSKYISIKVIKDKKTSFTTSSDLKKDTLEFLVKNAVKRTTMSNFDEFAGLPSIQESKINIHSLNLFDPKIVGMDNEKKIFLAKETERIALKDKRITNSHGANFNTREIKTILINSNGFSNEYDETFCNLSIGLQAGGIDNKVEGYWFSSKRHLEELDSPEEVAKKAVARTVRLLNPKKITTQNTPVIFEPMMTSWLLSFLFTCISGESIYQKTSFLVDKLGEKIGNEKITVYDDGLSPRKLGTIPFDSEGVPSQKTTVIEKGVLKNYLCNTYTARKLKLKSTGNASGNSIGPTNFYLQAGYLKPEEIISSMKKGLILARTIGQGLNPVTGDISRGAFGLWVENGEVVYPVSEITISGKLGTVLNDIEIIGNDLSYQSIYSGPTIKIGELTVAGK